MNSNLIIHLADIHIKNTERHKEYTEVFERLFKVIEKIKPLCVVIVGDMFHNKLMLSPEAFILARKLIKSIADITNIVLIPGNHDVNINNKARKDGIFAVIEEMNHPNIHYYRKSGLYKFLDTKINFGVFSVVDEIEPFPVQFEKNKDETYIALYHGSVHGSIAENKFILESNTKLEIFENYDIVMLGDIHKRQYLNKLQNIAYPGSLIQQDFGEEITKGVLIWDINSKESIFKPIRNDYGYINLYLNDLENLNEIYFAPKSHIRLISNQDIDDIKQNNLEKIIRNYLSNKHIEILDYVYEHVTEKSEIQVDSSVENIYDVNIQNELIREYLRKNLIKDEIIDACIKRNEELNEKITKSDYAIANWYPEELKFSNFFSYGENNNISIGNSKGITGIFGKNESGKCVDENTKIEIEFNKDEIINKLGFLPDELK